MAGVSLFCCGFFDVARRILSAYPSCTCGKAMLVVHTTFASRHQAEKAAETLVSERLAACASVFPVKSLFFWKGKLEKQREFALELKIAGKDYPKLEKRIRELSSHLLPEIIAIGVKKGSKEYLEWVEGARRPFLQDLRLRQSRLAQTPRKKRQI